MFTIQFVNERKIIMKYFPISYSDVRHVVFFVSILSFSSVYHIYSLFAKN